MRYVMNDICDIQSVLYIFKYYDLYTINLNIAEHRYIVSFHDICGDSSFRQHRQLVYPNADAFLLCFSVMNIDSTKRLKSLVINYLSLIHLFSG